MKKFDLDLDLLDHIQEQSNELINQINLEKERLKSGTLFEKQMAFNRLWGILKSWMALNDVVLLSAAAGLNIIETLKYEECCKSKINKENVRVHPIFKHNSQESEENEDLHNHSVKLH